MSQPVTIVSACDRNFIWGSFLLAASIARHCPGTSLYLLQTGFTPQDEALFHQFPGLRLLPLENNNPRCVANRKSEAILSAETDYIAWLDADCMIIGNVNPLLAPQNGEFQIRLREPWENAWVWRNHYAPDEIRGGIPKSVLTRWCEDVGQLDSPRLNTTCVTNAFVLHRRHLDFIHEWKKQISKVIPPVDLGVVDRSSPAYFMTDESVLSSLLVFSRLAPPVADFQLNRDPDSHVAHFGANPKPWKRWRYGLWYCNRHVLDLLDWVRDTGRATPPLPWSFQRRNRFPAYTLALASESWIQLRGFGGNLLRRK